MFLYRNNPLSETHRKQRPELLYGPLLESWRELLNWHCIKHPNDTETISVIKHMICVYAIEAVEMLYQTGRNEMEAEFIIDKYFCRDFLDNYRTILLSDNRVKQISFYYDNRQEFIIQQRKRGKVKIWKNRLKKWMLFRMINDKKYRTVLPKGILVS